MFLTDGIMSLVSANSTRTESNATVLIDHTNHTGNHLHRDILIKDIEDYKNYEIFAKIYFGSDQQPLKVIMDTGSGTVWVFARLCQNCKGPKFDERTSTSHLFYNTLYDFHYGIGDAYGFNSHDTVCITKDDCVEGFSFITTVHQVDLDNLSAASGIIGLTPSVANASRFDLFTDTFKTAGVLPKSVWSFFIDMARDTSKITFGGYDEEKFAVPGVDVVFHHINVTSGEW